MLCVVVNVVIKVGFGDCVCHMEISKDFSFNDDERMSCSEHVINSHPLEIKPEGMSLSSGDMKRIRIIEHTVLIF